jgi:hypothetical protein
VPGSDTDKRAAWPGMWRALHDRTLRVRNQACAIIRARIGLRTNKANATTRMFMMAVSKNTICQLPVETLIMLATGTIGSNWL